MARWWAFGRLGTSMSWGRGIVRLGVVEAETWQLGVAVADAKWLGHKCFVRPAGDTVAPMTGSTHSICEDGATALEGAGYTTSRWRRNEGE